MLVLGLLFGSRTDFAEPYLWSYWAVDGKFGYKIQSLRRDKAIGGV